MCSRCRAWPGSGRCAGSVRGQGAAVAAERFDGFLDDVQAVVVESGAHGYSAVASAMAAVAQSMSMMVLRRM